MNQMTCTICDDQPTFTDEGKFQFHLETAHCIHFYKCNDVEDLEKAIKEVLLPN